MFASNSYLSLLFSFNLTHNPNFREKGYSKEKFNPIKNPKIDIIILKYILDQFKSIPIKTVKKQLYLKFCPDPQASFIKNN